MLSRLALPGVPVPGALLPRPPVTGFPVATENPCCQRSTVLRAPLVAIAGAAAGWPLCGPLLTHAEPAALVVQPALAEGLASFLPALPPQPIALPRRRLGPEFAVLLLRSGYETADLLDFVPMDTFQRDFWLLRRSEWEPYTLQYSPLQIKQGDLSDPLYFDFIATMQTATVSRLLPNGLQLFREYCEECPEGFKMVTRDPALQDNAALPAAFERRTGELIYAGLREGYRGVSFGAPAPLPRGCTFAQLVAGVETLLAIFVSQGFAINARVERVQAAPGGAGGGSFVVRLEGPATLWSLQSLASRGALVYPAYDALAAAAFIRGSGREARCLLEWTDTAVTEKWDIL